MEALNGSGTHTSTHASPSAILGIQQPKTNLTSVARVHFGIYFIVSLRIVQLQHLGALVRPFKDSRNFGANKTVFKS